MGSPFFASSTPTAARFSKHQRILIQTVPTVAVIVHGTCLLISTPGYQLILGRSRALLSCTMHYCPSSCHQLSDHSKMHCDFVFHTSCVNGHSRKWKCHDGPPATCARCVRDQKAAEKAAERAKAEEAKLLEQRGAERSREEAVSARNYTARRTVGEGQGSSEGQHPPRHFES